MNRITQQAAKRQLIMVLGAFVLMNAAALLFYGLLTHQAMQSAAEKFTEIDHKRSTLNQISESFVVMENTIDRLFETHFIDKIEAIEPVVDAQALKKLQASEKLLRFYQTELAVSSREFSVLENLIQVIKRQQTEIVHLANLTPSKPIYQQMQRQLEMDRQKVQVDFRALRLNLDEESKQTTKLYEQNSANHFVIYWVLFFFLTVILALGAYRLVWLRSFFMPAGLFLSYRQALDNYFGICQLDAKGNFTHLNNNFCGARSTTEKHLIGQKYNTVVRAMNGEVWQQLKNNQSWYGVLEEPVVVEGGEQTSLVMQTLIFPIVEENSQIIEFVVLQFDVSDFVRARQLALDLTASQTHFLANVGHQLRTPLSALDGGMQLLRRRKVSVEDEKLFALIEKNSELLMSNVNELLVYADIISGKVVIQEQPCYLRNELKKFVDRFKPIAARQQIEFEVQIDERLPRCLIMDKENFFRVLQNLVDNAIKFTPEDGSVLLGLKLLQLDDDSAQIEFSISDTGVGMPEDKIGDIFKGFRRLEDIKTSDFGGTGIGLSISQQLVTLMGGEDIAVLSHLNAGSQFKFVLRFSRC